MKTRKKSTHDKRSDPKKLKSVLSEREQAIICEFRKVIKFSIDDCFVLLKMIFRSFQDQIYIAA